MKPQTSPSSSRSAAFATHAIAITFALTYAAGAADFNISSGNATIVPDYAPGDNVIINMATGYFGSSGARSQTFNDANITITSMLMNNGWGEAVTTFDTTTAVGGTGNIVLSTAGGYQDFVFAGNMQGYSGTMRMYDRSGVGTALGNTGTNIIQFGGATTGGTVAKGTATTDGTGTYINNVAGTGALGDATGQVNQVVFNYATSGTYSYLVASNNINARYAVHFTGGANVKATGQITGGAQLVKSGAGTVTFSSSNSYAGATTISGGVLSLTGSGTVGTGNITVEAGATFNVSGKTSGSQTMASGKSLGGAGTVIGSVVMASGSILAPTSGSTLTVGNLTFGSASNDTGIINIGSLGSYTTNAAVNVTGGLVLQGGAGKVTLNLTSGAISSGTYRLIGTTSLSDTAGFLLGTTSFLTSRQTGALALNSGSLDYVVTGSNPYWTGKLGSEWSTATLASPKNWETAPGVTTDFLVNDIVTFNDSATSTTVNIAADVTPASVEFNNSVINYSVTGSAGVAGSSTLVKNGSGTVTLSNANTYTGTTTINSGTLRVGAGGTTGTLGSGAIINNATLALARTDAATITNGLSGTGSVVVESGNVTFNNTKTYTGGTTVSGGILDLTGGGGTTGTIRGTATVNAGATLRLSATDATGYSTDGTRLSVINLPGGTLHVNTVGNQTLGSAVVNMTGGSISGIAGSNIDLFANGSAINTLASATTSTISLPSMNLRQNDTVFTTADGAATTDLLISSNLGNGSGGNHNLIKSGAGAMTLSGTNGYTGNTQINAGTLTISGRTSSTSAVTVTGGSSLVVATGGTLTTSGALSTANAAGANVMVQSGAVFNAASASIAWNPGTLRVDGTLAVTGNFGISTNASGTISGAGNITAGSFSVGNAGTTVNFSNSGTMTIGGDMTIAASSTGVFNQSGGTISANGLLLNSTTANTYTLTGGRLNLGPSGIGGNGATKTVSLGAGIVGARADWSSSLDISLTNAGSGTTFNTLDSVNNTTGRTITLTGALSGSGKLVKTGVGTLTLNGANSYAGATTVDAGKLIIGATGSLGNTAVTVGGTTAASTPTLGGGGTIAGATQISAANGGVAGTHSPGISTVDSGVGKQTFSSTLSYGAGSIFEWDINGNTTGNRGTAGGYDAVDGSGALTVDNTASTGTIFRIILGSGVTLTDSFWNTPNITRTWTNIFSEFSTLNGGFDTSNLQVTGQNVSEIGSFTITGTSLTWTAVPEPSSMLAGLLLVGQLLRRRR